MYPFICTLLTFVYVGAVFTTAADITDDDIFGSDYTSCGQNLKLDKNTKFIFQNPKEAANPPGSWPWAISLGTNTSTDWTHRCGGALINKNMVLTAAHCPLSLKDDFQSGSLYVRAGDSNLQDPKDDNNVQMIRVSGYTVHPEFKFQARYYDIAVLFLEIPAEFTEAVRAICVPEDPTSREEDTRLPLVVSAWGEDFNGESGTQLMDIKIQIYSIEWCNRTHEGQTRASIAVPQGFSDELFCAGDNAGIGGVCHGDSGSPAVLLEEDEGSSGRYLLKGIVSGGIACGTEVAPNIYIRISQENILSWIKQQKSPVVTPSTVAPGGAQDPDHCSVVTCTATGAAKFCPIKCTPDPDFCTVVDCTLQGSSAYCPIKCTQVWRSWSSWSSCSLTCGSGTKARSRTCSGGNCQGSNSESRICNTNSCPESVIFITGGYDGALGWGTEDSTEVLDPSSSNSPCSRLTANLPDSRYWHSMSSMEDGEIVICGGDYPAGTSCISTRSPGGPWRQHSTINTPRYWHASAVTGDLHLVAGGWSGTRDTASSLEDGRWKERGKLPYSIGGGACAVTINQTAIFVTGGLDARTKTAIWNPSTDEWTPMADMKQGRWGHGCSVVTTTGGDKYVLVAGGYDGGTRSTSEIYSVQGNTWTSTGSLKQARKYGAMVATDDRNVFMIGGKDGDETFDSVEKFHFETRTWGLTTLKMKKARYEFSAVSVNRNVFC